MNKRTMLAALAVCATCSATASHAGISGYFDYVEIGYYDKIVGWVCENTAPYTAPSGTLLLYIDGSYRGELTMSQVYWGDPGDQDGYRPDVNSAGYCGSNPYVAFNYNAWLMNPPSTTVDIYYKYPNGSTFLMGGSGKVCPWAAGKCY